MSNPRNSRRRNSNSSNGKSQQRSRNKNRGNSRGRSSNNRRNKGQTTDIHPSRYVKAAQPVRAETYEAQHTFEDFKFAGILKRNLARKNYVVPSQIQDKAIPLALNGDDVIGIANTGTGKTASFLLPLLDSLLNNREQRALILAPTRELALQIQEESRSLTTDTRIKDVLLIGGVSINKQIRDLQRKPAVIIGTPGRIKDHLERGTLNLSSASIVVLDEVDRMLDMGFLGDIRRILGELPHERQSLYFSATITSTIDDLIRTFTHSPKTVMAKTSETSDNVEQTVLYYGASEDKFGKLFELLEQEELEKALVFCKTKYGAERLSKKLSNGGISSVAIHGNKNQNQRQRALAAFRNHDANVLVATDVAARGIDVEGVTHVVNFDQPNTYEDYTHRIGRTGRAGKTGVAVTMLEGRERT